MDVLAGYILASMFFVFAAMMEFAVLLVVKRKMDGIKIRPEIEKVDTGINPTKREQHLQMTNLTRDDFPQLQAEMKTESQKQRNPKKCQCWGSSVLTNNVDFVAFFIFILGFSVFNCIYWKHNIQDFNI